MKYKKSSQTATLAMFIAIMVIIEVVSQAIFANFVLPVKPTITLLPVIVASILYGPKLGAQLGAFMGIMSVVRNSIILVPLSYVFSPFVQNGNLYSLLIAIAPRMLIGVTPYFVYKWCSNRTGLVLAGLTGALTNTLFVLAGIFFCFPSVYNGDARVLLASIVSFNSLAEISYCVFLTVTIVPIIRKVRK